MTVKKKWDANLSTLESVLEELKSDETNRNKINFILFLANDDPATNRSWCPDCIRAELVIYKNLEKFFFADTNHMIPQITDEMETKEYSHILIFFPAALFFVLVSRARSAKSEVAWHIAMILLNPCLILIDNGHFQYNCISLGLTVGAIAAFFSHLLGKCLRRKSPILAVLKLGIAVIVTFVIVWWPWPYLRLNGSLPSFSI